MMSKKKIDPSASDLRHEVLRRMGMEGSFYAQGSAHALDVYVAKLEELWRWREAFDVRCRAEEAVRAAIDALPHHAAP